MKIRPALRFILILTVILAPCAVQADAPMPYLVKDINPGGDGLNDQFTHFLYQGKFWFAAYDGSQRNQWWTSDGTTEGTLPSVIQGKMNNAQVQGATIVINDVAYFTAVQPGSGNGQLWRTDGTADGTWRIIDLPYPNTISGFLGTYNGWLWMFAKVNYQFGIYRFNLSTESMQQVLPLDCYGNIDFEDLGQAWLVTEGCTLLTLWKVDKDSQFPLMIKDLGYIYGYGLMVKMGNLEYINQDGIWQTDGTPEGTVQIIQNPDLYKLTVMNGWLYYTTVDFEHHCVMRTQSGAEQIIIKCFTSLHADDIQQILSAGNHVFFLSAGEDYNLPQRLWVTDGSVSGTQPLTSGDYGVGGIDYLFGGQIFFHGFDPQHGSEMWVSDGTPEGTHLYADMTPGPDSSIYGPLFLAGDKLFFCAYDAIHGRELWAMDYINRHIFLPIIRH